MSQGEFHKFMNLIEEEIGNSYKLPDSYNTLKKSLPTVGSNTGKRNANNQGKVSGKYFKGQDNTSGKMVSDQDKLKNTDKGKLKGDLDQAMSGHTRVLSRDRFDKLLGGGGKRAINFSDGKEKILNSKTSEYVATELSDGRIKVVKKSTA